MQGQRAQAWVVLEQIMICGARKLRLVCGRVFDSREGMLMSKLFQIKIGDEKLS